MFLVEANWNVNEFGPVIRSAVVETAKHIRERSRADIAQAGRFGRYAKGYTTQVQRAPGGYAIQCFLNPGFLKVFEYGGTSVGKPLLWVPVKPLRIKLRRYGGKLIRPKGKRVLFRPSDRRIMYVGVSSITNRQRFHLRTIAYQEAERLMTNMVDALHSVRSATTP